MNAPGNVEMSEEDMRIIQLGNGAAYVLTHMTPILESGRRAALSRLKSMQRAGKFDAASAQAEVAALCALDDLQSRLEQQVNVKEGVIQALTGDNV